MFEWRNIVSFLNSNFTAALAGALAGALIAQKIGDRAKQRDVLLKEIRSTNAAIMICFSVCSAGLALKRQYVREIYEAYTAKKSELEDFKKRRIAGEHPPDLPFEFEANFLTLQMPLMPIDVLRSQVYENVSASGRPLALVAEIARVATSLADTMQSRNKLIDRFRQINSEDQDLLAALYFGFPYGPGHVSTEFSDTIESLHSQTEDLIFFSEMLVKDLMDHGNQILNQYRKIAKIKKEKISSVDFGEAHKLGLMPDPKNYASWINSIRKAV